MIYFSVFIHCSNALFVFAYFNIPSKRCTCSCRKSVEQGEFTDWISFLPSNLRKQISPNQEILVQIPINFNQHEIAAKTKHYLGINALINQLFSTHLLWICSLAPGQDSYLSQMINQNKLLFCAYFVGNLP